MTIQPLKKLQAINKKKTLRPLFPSGLLFRGCSLGISTTVRRRGPSPSPLPASLGSRDSQWPALLALLALLISRADREERAPQLERRVPEAGRLDKAVFLQNTHFYHCLGFFKPMSLIAFLPTVQQQQEIKTRETIIVHFIALNYF